MDSICSNGGGVCGKRRISGTGVEAFAAWHGIRYVDRIWDCRNIGFGNLPFSRKIVLPADDLRAFDRDGNSGIEAVVEVEMNDKKEGAE